MVSQDEHPRRIVALTLNVSTVTFHTTNAPIPVLLLLMTTYSSIYTPLAQHASFLSSRPSVLSWSVIAPARTDSTDILETERLCDCTQYGGDVIERELSAVEGVRGVVGCGSSLEESFNAAELPWTLPLLWFWLCIDSIHWQAPIRQRDELIGMNFEMGGSIDPTARYANEKEKPDIDVGFSLFQVARKLSR